MPGPVAARASPMLACGGRCARSGSRPSTIRPGATRAPPPPHGADAHASLGSPTNLGAPAADVIRIVRRSRASELSVGSAFCCRGWPVLAGHPPGSGAFPGSPEPQGEAAEVGEIRIAVAGDMAVVAEGEDHLRADDSGE